MNNLAKQIKAARGDVKRYGRLAGFKRPNPNDVEMLGKSQALLAELTECRDKAEIAAALQSVIDEQLGREIVYAAARIHNSQVAAAQAKRRDQEGT